MEDSILAKEYTKIIPKETKIESAVSGLAAYFFYPAGRTANHIINL
jgi:hypothetical protein